MQILRQFGELSPDLIDMQRYAAWKAADIRKALREGRTPTAGAPANAASAEQDLLDELGLPSVPGKPCSTHSRCITAGVTCVARHLHQGTEIMQSHSKQGYSHRTTQDA